MKRSVLLYLSFGKYLIHSNALGFFRSLPNIQNANAHLLCAERNGNHVTELNVVGRLRAFAVYRNARAVARFVGNGPAFDQAGYLQILIEAHFSR